jgi:hypothetical protein
MRIGWAELIIVLLVFATLIGVVVAVCVVLLVVLRRPSTMHPPSCPTCGEALPSSGTACPRCDASRVGR